VFKAVSSMAGEAEFLKNQLKSQQSSQKSARYGVATVSRIDKIIGLFCERDL